MGQTASAAPLGLPEEAICAAETSKAERDYDIPSQLLDSISLVESGRFDRETKLTLAWPWTVMAEGKGRYFATKYEAIAEVKKLHARGIKNIDVGCMQINMRYHGHAFDTVEDAFDPYLNVGYAARFLRGLYESTGQWVTAASYYHSQTPHLASAYKERLLKVWRKGGSRDAIASLVPVPGGKAVEPVLVDTDRLRRETEAKVEATRQAKLAKEEQEREEAKRIATAYRHAKITEYKLRMRGPAATPASAIAPPAPSPAAVANPVAAEPATSAPDGQPQD